MTVHTIQKTKDADINRKELNKRTQHLDGQIE